MVLDLSFLTRPRIDFSRFKTIQNIRKSFDLFMGYNESLTLEDKIMGSLHQKSTNSMLNIIGQYSGEIINDLQGYDVLSANITQVVNQAKQILFEEFSEYVVGDTSISLSELIDVQYKIEQIRSKNSHTDFYELKPVLIVNGQRRELQGLELYTKVGSKSGPEIMMPKLQARKDDFPRVQNAIDMNQIGNMIIMTPLTKTPLFETYEYLHDLGVTTENLEFFSTIVDYVRLRNIAVSKERWNRFSHEVSKGYKKIDADIVTKFFSRTKKAYQLFGGLGGINLGALDYASKRLSRFSKYESIKIDEEEANNWIDLDSLLCLMSSGENIDEINYLLDNARLGNINDLKTVTNAIIKSISRNDYGTLGEIKDGKKLVYMYPIGSDLSLVALSPSTNGKWGFSNLGKSLDYPNFLSQISKEYEKRFKNLTTSDEVELITTFLKTGYLNGKQPLNKSNSQSDSLDYFTNILLQGITNLRLFERIKNSDEFSPDFVEDEMVYVQALSIARYSNFLLQLIDTPEINHIYLRSTAQDLENSGDIASLKYIALIGRDLGNRIVGSLDKESQNAFFGETLEKDLSGEIYDFETLFEESKKLEQSIHIGQYSSALERSLRMLDKIEYVELQDIDQLVHMFKVFKEIKSVLNHFEEAYKKQDPQLSEVFKLRAQGLKEYDQSLLNLFYDWNNSEVLRGTFDQPVMIAHYLGDEDNDYLDMELDFRALINLGNQLSEDESHLVAFSTVDDSKFHLPLGDFGYYNPKDMRENKGFKFRDIFENADLATLVVMKNLGKEYQHNSGRYNILTPDINSKELGDVLYFTSIALAFERFGTRISFVEPVMWSKAFKEISVADYVPPESKRAVYMAWKKLIDYQEQIIPKTEVQLN